ncbi:MAG TPA: hypothetical protein PLN48_09280 [Lachnospiraceae bacterium]|nr:hypothetical protein [Lachnospiraceae bacterium]
MTKKLRGRKLIGYLWDYYKFAFIVAGILLYILFYIISGHSLHKDSILYIAMVNFAPGEEMTQNLTDGFLEEEGIDSSKQKITLYNNLILTSDNADDSDREYSYAAKMKILGAVNAEKLDVVLMDDEAFEAFSENGLLMDLTQLQGNIPSGLYKEAENRFTDGTEILEDNAVEITLSEATDYKAETAVYPMGIRLNGLPRISDQLNGTLYLGIIKNSPRTGEAFSYLAFLNEN